MLRKNLQTHRNECPLELIPCSFSGLGCKTKVCRKDLKEHIDSSGLSHHMDLLAMSHMTMQAEHAALQIEHTTLNDVCTSLQKEYTTLQAEHQELLIEHTTLKGTCNSLRKDHVTLQTAHTSLQNACAFLDREQLALIADHNTLKGTCKSELAALQRSHGQLQNEYTALSAALEDDFMHSLQPTTKETAPVLTRAKLPETTSKLNTASSVTELPRQTQGSTSTLAIRNMSKEPLSNTSKQALGNTFYIPIGQDGINGNHKIVLRNITLKLEWEPGDLF